MKLKLVSNLFLERGNHHIECMDKGDDRTVRKLLSEAIELDDKEEVERLVQAGCRLNMYIETADPTSTTRYTLLGAAISRGANAVFDFLLEQGADVNKIQYRSSDTEQEKFFPLHLACLEGRVHMIPKLVASGANINACVEGPVSMEEEGGSLHYTGAGNTSLHWAVLNSRLPELLALLKSGAAPCLVNDIGETPFSLACGRYKPEMIRALCKAGGVVESHNLFENPLEELLLHEGDIDENSQLIKLVLQAGYKPSIQLRLLLDTNSGCYQRETREDFCKDICKKYGHEFTDWLKNWLFEPRRLECACREVIRDSILLSNVHGQGLQMKVQSLDIPMYLKAYLLLNTTYSIS